MLVAVNHLRDDKGSSPEDVFAIQRAEVIHTICWYSLKYYSADFVSYMLEDLKLLDNVNLLGFVLFSNNVFEGGQLAMEQHIRLGKCYFEVDTSEILLQKISLLAIAEIYSTTLGNPLIWISQAISLQ
ncbi:hypothetical protein P8452_38181 [Trifolium repens]|nr:hypothetical protein P8452_38181 [Trifolium repens]